MVEVVNGGSTFYLSQINNNMDAKTKGVFRSNAIGAGIRILPDLPIIANPNNDFISKFTYLKELVRELQSLFSNRGLHQNEVHHVNELLISEIRNIVDEMQIRLPAQFELKRDFQLENNSKLIRLEKKIPIPTKGNCKYIGRIIGPKGMTVKKLEFDTNCKILIRGEGSIKDEAAEKRMKNRPGWEHLNEPLHVLLIASDVNYESCTSKLARAAEIIETLLSTDNDEHKRKQLVILSVINGTYRPSRFDREPPQLPDQQISPSSIIVLNEKLHA